MICPFCQAPLDPKATSCPRCAAAYPGGGSGVMAGFRFRTFLPVFILIFLLSLMLVNCVLDRLPGTSDTGPARSPAVMRELLMMQQHQQATQNTAQRPPMH